jgi:hypothetical protein
MKTITLASNEYEIDEYGLFTLESLKRIPVQPSGYPNPSKFPQRYYSTMKLNPNDERYSIARNWHDMERAAHTGTGTSRTFTKVSEQESKLTALALKVFVTNPQLVPEDMLPDTITLSKTDFITLVKTIRG